MKKRISKSDTRSRQICLQIIRSGIEALAFLFFLLQFFFDLRHVGFSLKCTLEDGSMKGLQEKEVIATRFQSTKSLLCSDKSRDTYGQRQSRKFSANYSAQLCAHQIHLIDLKVL